MKKGYFFKVFNILLLMLAISACRKDDALQNSGQKAGTVEFEIRLPGDIQHNPGTYAMSDDDENRIESINVLAFQKQNSQLVYCYQKTAGSVTQNGNIVSFRLDAETRKDEQVFMILVNGKQALAAAGPRLGETMNDIIARLQVSSASEWEARNNGQAQVRSIPMCGYTQSQVIGNQSIRMNADVLRMLARLDVQVDPALSSSDFELVNACIFNRQTSGNIAYDRANWNQSKGSVNTPFVPQNVKSVKQPGLSFDITSAQSISGAIYTFESNAPSDKAHASAIVVGARYHKSQSITYYRLDIPQYDAQGKALVNTLGPILRNHLYQIRIASASQPGAGTPQQAFDESVTINASIKDWSLASQQVILDGQHTLISSKSRLLFDVDSGTHKFEVITDGQSVNVSSADNWLHPRVSASGSRYIVSVRADANGQKASRKGMITVSSNNMNYKLSVSQEATPWITFSDLSEAYVLDGKSNSFKVEKAISSWKCEILTNPGNHVPNFSPDSGLAVNAAHPINFSTTNNVSVSGKALPTDPGVHTSKLVFKDKTGEFADKTVDLVLVSGIIQEQSNCYILAGSAYPVLIPVKRINDAAGAIQALGGNSSSLSSLPLKATDHIHSKLVWSDHPGKGKQSNIESFYAAGKGPSGYLYVAPGASAGNALLAISTDNGKIKWSWHIWTAQPGDLPRASSTHAGSGSSKFFMDRNLGAMTSDYSKNESYGFLYQWGRKDPLPNSASGIKIYDGNGKQQNYPDKQAPQSGTQDNLLGSIENPWVYYNSSSTDWYTSGSSNTTAFWKDDLKTVFDPCPKGYRMATRSDMMSPAKPGDIINLPKAGHMQRSQMVQGTYAWTSTTVQQLPIALFGRAGSTMTSRASGFRSDAKSVRCVQE